MPCWWSDAMLWENADLEEVITGHMGIGVTMLRDGVPIDVPPLERVGEASFLEPYRVIFNWLPLSRTERAALAKWVQEGGSLVCLPSTRPEDEFLKEIGVELQGTRMHSAPLSGFHKSPRQNAHGRQNGPATR